MARADMFLSVLEDQFFTWDKGGFSIEQSSLASFNAAVSAVRAQIASMKITYKAELYDRRVASVFNGAGLTAPTATPPARHRHLSLVISK